MPLRPWRVTESRYLLRDRWLTVRSDDCVTESGVVVSPYYVLEYPDWAHVAAFDADGRLLVIRQYRHALGRICIELPGGIIDAGEDPLTAVRRELAEETGYGTKDWESLGAFSPNPATHTNTVYGFLARHVRPTATPQFDVTEDMTHEFITVDELMRLIDAGEFAQGLQIATILLALRRLRPAPDVAE